MAGYCVARTRRNDRQAEIFGLPNIGIKGNTHFLFQDKNNQEVANGIDDWLN